MADNEVELTPSGLSTKGALLNLNKSRMRAIYYRPDGQATTLLPADPYSQAYYFAKGLRAKPPAKLEVNSPQVTEVISCPDCGFKAKSAFGLQAHLRKHK